MSWLPYFQRYCHYITLSASLLLPDCIAFSHCATLSAPLAFAATDYIAPARLSFLAIDAAAAASQMLHRLLHFLIRHVLIRRQRFADNNDRPLRIDID